MLPTFGVGKDLSVQEWNSYLLQMIQLGLIEVAYEDHFHLRPTQAGKKVLKRERKVELARYTARIGDYISRRDRRAPEAVIDARTPQEKLADRLKRLRAELAEKENVADYMIFSDVTIKAISERMPTMPEELLGIEALSLVKIGKYYKAILGVVREAKGLKRALPLGISNRISLMLFRQGLDVDTIAEARGFAVSTIAAHICTLYEEGEDVDIWRIVPEELYRLVCRYIDSFEPLDLSNEITVEERQERGKRLQKYLTDNYSVSPALYSKVCAMRRVLASAVPE